MAVRLWRVWVPVWCLLLCVAAGVPQAAAAEETAPEYTLPEGWWWPSIGAGRGYWDLKVGVHAWTDKFYLRNLRWRGLVDLGPGLRAVAVIRSNSDLYGITTVAPKVDELYLERFGFYTHGEHRLSLSLRLGSVRYLRFPYPDFISMFDQVPGTEDLRGVHPTGYSGLLVAAEYAHDSGLGFHLTGIEWGFGRPSGRNLIEGYGFLRQQLGNIDLEVRAGILAVRPEPLGKGAPGFNIYIGYRDPEWQAGILYEQIEGQPVRTGVLVRFSLPQGNSAPVTGAPDRRPGMLSVTVPLERFTRFAGGIALDYTRSPQGIAGEVLLAKGTIGDVLKAPPPGTELVGELVAERVTTYWQNGQSRNLYEHVLGKWGRTEGPDLAVVMAEEPWYLQLEALVSPNILSLTGFRKWERQRQGPAQLAQRVVYRFYAPAGGEE